MLNVSELSRVPEVYPVPFSRIRWRERTERSREKINEVRASNRQDGLFGLVGLISICSKVVGDPCSFFFFCTTPTYRRPRHGNFKK